MAGLVAAARRSLDPTNLVLQALSLKLGTVTGMDLAQLNHRYLPRWLELFIYAIAEACIICTDVGQVISTAIALNILISPLPLPAACVVSVADTLLLLLFHSPHGELRRVRIFEILVSLLVCVVFSTLIILLTMVSEPARDVFFGVCAFQRHFCKHRLVRILCHSRRHRNAACLLRRNVAPPHSPAGLRCKKQLIDT